MIYKASKICAKFPLLPSTHIGYLGHFMYFFMISIIRYGRLCTSQIACFDMWPLVNWDKPGTVRYPCLCSDIPGMPLKHTQHRALDVYQAIISTDPTHHISSHVQQSTVYIQPTHNFSPLSSRPPMPEEPDTPFPTAADSPVAWIISQQQKDAYG